MDPEHMPRAIACLRGDLLYCTGMPLVLGRIRRSPLSPDHGFSLLRLIVARSHAAFTGGSGGGSIIGPMLLPFHAVHFHTRSSM